jgi:acetyl esterase
MRSIAMTSASPVVLEPAAQQVADAFSRPPFIYEKTPAEARKILEDAQSSVKVSMPAVDEEWITVPSPAGDVRVRIIRPRGADGMLPVIVYMHGGGWDPR